jgi:hypothetical protein
MAEDQAEYLVWRDYLATVPFCLAADVLSARRLMDEALEAIAQSVGVPAHLYQGL